VDSDGATIGGQNLRAPEKFEFRFCVLFHETPSILFVFNPNRIQMSAEAKASAPKAARNGDYFAGLSFSMPVLCS
jgi:hypothetical protein